MSNQTSKDLQNSFGMLAEDASKIAAAVESVGLSSTEVAQTINGYWRGELQKYIAFMYARHRPARRKRRARANWKHKQEIAARTPDPLTHDEWGKPIKKKA